MGVQAARREEQEHPSYHYIVLKGRRMPATVMLAKRQLEALVRRGGYDGVLIKAESHGKKGELDITGRMPTVAITGVLDRLGCNYEIEPRAS